MQIVKKFLLSLFLIGLIAVLSACATNKSVNKLYLAGQQAYKQQNYHTAFEKLFRAAKKGDANAQYAVGYMYYNGIGIDRDQARALKWFTKAAKQGQLRAVEALQRLNKNAEKEAFNLPKNKRKK